MSRGAREMQRRVIRRQWMPAALLVLSTLSGGEDAPSVGRKRCLQDVVYDSGVDICFG